MSWLKAELEKITIPGWVRYVAQDADGACWGYSVEPLQNHHGWYENEVGQNIKLLQGRVNRQWVDSLLKLR